MPKSWFLEHYRGRAMDEFQYTGSWSATNAIKFLNQQTGKRYDYTMVIRFLTHQQEARKSRRKWFCSELVFAALRKGAGHELLRCDPWQVAPGHLAWIPELRKLGG